MRRVLVPYTIMLAGAAFTLAPSQLEHARPWLAVGGLAGCYLLMAWWVRRLMRKLCLLAGTIITEPVSQDEAWEIVMRARGARRALPSVFMTFSLLAFFFAFPMYLAFTQDEFAVAVVCFALSLLSGLFVLVSGWSCVNDLDGEQQRTAQTGHSYLFQVNR